MFVNGKYKSISDTTARWSTLTRSRMMCDIVVLASTTMVAVLSSRISFSRGVGSWLSSSMRTDSVSLEMRNRRRSCSRFRRPVGILNIKKQRNITLEPLKRSGSSQKQSHTWIQICSIFVPVLHSWMILQKALFHGPSGNVTASGNTAF